VYLCVCVCVRERERERERESRREMGALVGYCDLKTIASRDLKTSY
jgi:hypothetical protein